MQRETALAQWRGVLAVASMLGLVLIALTGCAGTSENRNMADEWKNPSLMPDRLLLKIADLEGKTLQSIGPQGPRFHSFWPGGRWTAMDDYGKPQEGEWNAEEGKLCLMGGSWYTSWYCISVYGSAGDVVGVISPRYPAVLQAASLYTTDDPSDGAHRFMKRSADHDSQFAIPYRLPNPIFLKPSDLEGKVIEVRDHGGRYWVHFMMGGVMRFQDYDGHEHDGGWTISEFGEVRLQSAFWWRDGGYWAAFGRINGSIEGIYAYEAPLSYFPVDVHSAE